MPNDFITDCDDRGPQYEFCRDPDYWKEDRITYNDLEKEPEIYPVIFVKSDSFEGEFNFRADRWERETAIHSSPAEKYLHKDYQYIISKGERAVPFILKHLEHTGADWFWALDKIAGEDESPDKDAKTFEEAVRLWKQWAHTKGLLR